MEEIRELHPTHTKWCIWYHNPFDKNWGLSSYSKVYEFDNIESFWNLYKEWDNYLPKIYDGMFFLMRKIGDNVIYPLWEDKNNRRGGFWSFKVDKELSPKIWLDLSIYIISENLCVNSEQSMLINGISISPKKNFCIIKIWNNDQTKSDLGLLNGEIPNLNFEECMYKCHVDNIANDKIKVKKYTKNNIDKNSKKYK